MKYNPVGWFEIPVTDLDRAKKFYGDLLQIEFQEYNGQGYQMLWFPMHDDAMGSTGALVKGEGYHPGASGTVVYFSAPDIDGTIERAKELGAEIIMPKKDIGEYGLVAWLKDSEGNIIALHTMKDKEAKE